jgi:protein SCO1/2
MLENQPADSDGRRTLGRRFEATVADLTRRTGFWVALVALIAAWPVVWSLRTPLPAPLPTIATVPSFELVDDAGQPFGSRELGGRVWVASFMFTRCTTVCPIITGRMQQLQRRLRQLEPELHLVSFSVDPEYDTPERLRDYARQHHASPRLWSFLTGPRAIIRGVVVDGLRAAMGEEVAPDGGSAGPFHDAHLVLVDRAGRVRGYYDSSDTEAMERVVRDAALLVNRGS